MAKGPCQTSHFGGFHPFCLAASMGQDPRCQSHSGALILRIHFAALNSIRPSNHLKYEPPFGRGCLHVWGAGAVTALSPGFYCRSAIDLLQKPFETSPREEVGVRACEYPVFHCVILFPVVCRLPSFPRFHQISRKDIGVRHLPWGFLSNSGTIIKGVPYS